MVEKVLGKKRKRDEEVEGDKKHIHREMQKGEMKKIFTHTEIVALL